MIVARGDRRKKKGNTQQTQSRGKENYDQSRKTGDENYSQNHKEGRTRNSFKKKKGRGNFETNLSRREKGMDHGANRGFQRRWGVREPIKPRSNHRGGKKEPMECKCSFLQVVGGQKNSQGRIVAVPPKGGGQKVGKASGRCHKTWGEKGSCECDNGERWGLGGV